MRQPTTRLLFAQSCARYSDAANKTTTNEKGDDMHHNRQHTFGGVQPFGVSGPHWKKSCLGLHIKYTTLTKTDEQKEGFK